MDNDMNTVAASKMTEANACRKKQAFAYKRTADDGDRLPVYYRTKIAVDAVINAISGHHTPKEIMWYMSSRYAREVKCFNPQERPALCLYDHFPVARYVKVENRTPKYYRVSRQVMMGDVPVTASAHLGFEQDNGKTIELVLLKLSKPTMTQKGRGNAFNRDFLIYSLILLGRKLGYSNVVASIYFLRKYDDSYNFQKNDDSFFGTNVISFRDEYKGEDTAWDRKMKDLLTVWKCGIPETEQEEDTCGYCDLRHICKYKLPPKEIEKEENVAGTSMPALRFSPEQQRAIDARKGVFRLLAVAGAGKTSTIVERIVHMLLEGVKPEEILAITFTVAAAKVMKKRISKRYAQMAPADNRVDISGLTVATFNAFMHTIAAANWKELGYARQLRVLNSLKTYTLIDEILCENPIAKWDYKAFGNYNAKKGYQTQRGALRIAELAFRACKKCDLENEQRTELNVRRFSGIEQEEIGPSALEDLIRLYDVYENRLREQGLIDFDDQELLAFKVMELGDGKYYEKTFKFRHIIVDEFQDTSFTQIRFLRYLKENLPTYESLMAVGDDFQSIYAFRDTSPEFFINLEQYIGEPVTDILLDTNYRSTQPICDFANAVIAPNREKVDKTLVSAKGKGAPVIVNGYYVAQNETDEIVRAVKRKIMNGAEPTDIAIMAYTKAELQKFADALTKAGIPSNFAAPEVMIENGRVLAILLFAKLIYDSNRQDALTVANVLIGGGIMEKEEEEINDEVSIVFDKADAIRSVEDDTVKKQLFLDFVDEVTFGDETVENMKEELETLEYDEIIEYCTAFRRFGSDIEYRRLRDYPGVKLITVHSFKGDESPIVFLSLTKFNKGKSMRVDDVEETRRLFFVGVTRARDELYITGTFTSGTKANPVQNRFLYEAYQIAGKQWPLS